VLFVLISGCHCNDNRAELPPPPPIPAPKDTPLIRVLIVRAAETVTVECSRRALVNKTVPLEPHTSLSFSLSGDKVRFNNSNEVAPDFTIEPEIDGTLIVEGMRYRGVLRIFVFEGKLCVVNILNLESYVASVVGSEMGDKFSPAALAAQAVAARTYALYYIQKSSLKPWDITTGTEAQVYRGVNIETDSARDATCSTKGFVLTYEGKVFPAFYSSTCGGCTSSAEFVFGGKLDITPLRGGVECYYCEKSPYYRWNTTVPEEEILKIVRTSGAEPSSVKSITLAETDIAKRGKFVEIVTDLGVQRIGIDKFRASLGYNRLRSALFTVEKKDGNFIFSGKGWGHGVGMCQWGAEGMAKQGFSPEEILKYYYPACEVTRIY